MNKYLTKAKVQKLVRTNKIVKLNIGCGNDYKDGWINIDNNSDENIDKLDLYWDLRNPLPFKDNSVAYIYNEHFLEHLTVEEGQTSIKDFMRVLKKGGVMRIAMPDLEEVVEQYNDPQWKQKPFLKEFGLDFVQTRAELINIGFRWWGHKWLYNWEELDRRLREAGCKNIRQCELRKSLHNTLQDLETRKQSILIAEVTK